MILDYFLIGLMWLLGLICVALLIFALLLLFGVIDINGPVCPPGQHLLPMQWIGTTPIYECA